MALLGLSDGAPPSADDLTPVLIYVILKVRLLHQVIIVIKLNK